MIRHVGVGNTLMPVLHLFTNIPEIESLFFKFKIFQMKKTNSLILKAVQTCLTLKAYYSKKPECLQ